jgi:hypothetical protein
MDAIEALLNPTGGVYEWAHLLGIDGDFLREQLCRMAGIPPH